MKIKNLEIVDSGLVREKFAGTYILSDGNETALIEVSTSYAVDRILNRLKELNISKSDVKYIFITHIHLDHSAGVGKLLKQLPNAKLVVQPSGAKHMIDPSKLIAGAIAVYGKDVVKKDYGEMVPIPEHRVIACNDLQIFYIGDRALTTIFTPGHARHHMSIFDAQTSGIFTGDSLGLSYPEMNVEGRSFYQPTTTPTAFEYDKMLESIDKMIALNPKFIFFTHYGISNRPDEVVFQIKRRIKDYKDMVESLPNYDNDQINNLENLLRTYYINEGKSHGTALTDKEISTLFSIDIKLNAMGLLIWKQRETV